MTCPGSGMGVTLTFGTSAFTAEITGISGGDMVREWYDTTHFGSPVGGSFSDVRWMEQCPADMASVTDIVVEIIYDIDATPPIDQPIEAITIQAPPKVGQVTGGKIEFDGGMKQYNGASFGMRDVRRGQYTLAVTGDLAFTPGA